MPLLELFQRLVTVILFICIGGKVNITSWFCCFGDMRCLYKCYHACVFFHAVFCRSGGSKVANRLDRKPHKYEEKIFRTEFRRITCHMKFARFEEATVVAKMIAPEKLLASN